MIWINIMLGIAAGANCFYVADAFNSPGGYNNKQVFNTIAWNRLFKSTTGC